MKVFISSVIGGMEKFRDAAADAIDSLGYEVLRAEDFHASPTPPRLACLQGVQNSDVVVLLVGERYGDPQSSGLSPTHEEYEEALRNNLPVIVMVQNNVRREENQTNFLNKVREWNDGHYTESFDSPTNLRKITTRSLHVLTQQLAHMPHDVNDISDHAIHELSDEHNLHLYQIRKPARWHHDQQPYTNRIRAQSPALAVCLSCGHNTNILSPSQIESQNIKDTLTKLALHIHDPLFSTSVGTQTVVDEGNLIVAQEDRFVRLDKFGTLTYTGIMQNNNPMRDIVEEDVKEDIARFIEFSKNILDHIDDSFRLPFCAVAAHLLNSNFVGWITRSQQRQQQDLISVISSQFGKNQPVTRPSHAYRRNELSQLKTQIAHDLTILLRQSVHER